MEQQEIQEESTKNPIEEITEEQFLKNLYIFMEKRDTPIERIPNLGFKQIDLFVMFKTVNDLGGYHQVTSHQLWKQVYNTLGGNPRSTSAATCTRRHYEKLLLPYECHLKGILMTSMPHHQPRPYRYAKDEDGGQRPSKRRLLSLPLGPYCFQSDPHANIYPLPLQYPHYYQPLLPPYVPMPSPVITPHPSPAPKLHQFPFQPTHPESSNMHMDSLQLLRWRAEQYKTSTALSNSEPLNLSKKAPAPESDTNPASSFSQPSSSKNPKFLNKPSPLYIPHHAGVSEVNDTQDGGSGESVPTFSESEKKNETQHAEVHAPVPSDSPIFISALMPEPNKDFLETTTKPISPKADFPVQPAEDSKATTEVEGFNLSHLLHGIPKEKEGKMEIEVPLSVFCNWLKLCGSSAKLPEAKEFLVSDYGESAEKTSALDVDNFPTDLSLRSPQRNSSPEDLRLGNKWSLLPNTQADNHQERHLTSSKTSGGLRKREAGQDIWSSNQQDINKSYKFKSPEFWNAYYKETVAPHSHIEPNSSPSTFRGFPSKLSMEEMAQRARQRLEVESSAGPISPASVFPLTADKMRKLQNILSSSS